MQNQLLILSTNKSPIYMDSKPNDIVILHDELDPVLLKLGFRIWDIEYFPTLKESTNWVTFDNWFKDLLACGKELQEPHQIPIELTYKLLGGRLISQT